MKNLSKSIDSVKNTKKCPIHGDYECETIRLAKRNIVKPCPKCAKEQREKREAEERDSMLRKRKSTNLELRETSGVPMRYIESSFDDVTATSKNQIEIKNQIIDYTKRLIRGEFLPSMIITGDVGTGKTLYASSIINTIIPLDENPDYAKNVCLIKVIDLSRSLKETWRKDSIKTERQLIQEYSRYDLLIIDEMGMSFESDTERLFITDIIDGRYNNMLPTLLISNYDIDGVKKTIGKRAVDRLREGGGKVLGLNWGSFRS